MQNSQTLVCPHRNVYIGINYIMQLMKLIGMQACPCSSRFAQAHNMHTHMRTQTHTHTHAHIRTHTCTSAHTHTGAHTHRHTCTRAHAHTQTHTHSHTRAHTHAHTLAIAPKQRAKLAHACSSSSSSDRNNSRSGFLLELVGGEVATHKPPGLKKLLEKGWLLNVTVK